MSDEVISAPAFSDQDLVYVDPDARAVVARVEFSKNGDPKSLPLAKKEGSEAVDERKRWRKFYPFGTYRAMKKIYHLEGKIGKQQPTKTLDQVIERALQEPFWD